MTRQQRAALALQAAAAPLAVAHPNGPRFRAGVNTGEASVGVLGSGSGLAPAGRVAISAETARGLWGAKTEPLGTVAVSGRAEPVEVLHLVGLPPR